MEINTMGDSYPVTVLSNGLILKFMSYDAHGYEVWKLFNGEDLYVYRGIFIDCTNNIALIGVSSSYHEESKWNQT